MELSFSPDWPCNVTYPLAWAFALWVTVRRTTEILGPDDQQLAWSYFEWYFLIFVQSLIPVFLFFVLDYSGSLRDTSIFAAILTGLFYREIVSGKLADIKTKGLLVMIFAPFLAWAEDIAKSLSAKVIIHKEQFKEDIVRLVSNKPSLYSRLEVFAFAKCPDQAALKSQLQEIEGSAANLPGDQQMRDAVIRERKSEHLLDEVIRRNKDYPGELFARQVVGWQWPKLYWHRRLHVVWRVALLIGVLLASWKAIPIMLEISSIADLKPHFFLYRLSKADTSIRDQQRTSDYFRAALDAAPSNSESTNAAEKEKPPLSHAGHAHLMQLLELLRQEDLGVQSVSNVFRIILEARSRVSIDSPLVPALIGALRNRNPVTAAESQKFLVYVADSLAGTSLLPDLRQWTVPKDNELFYIDARVAAWSRWWKEFEKKSTQPSVARGK